MTILKVFVIWRFFTYKSFFLDSKVSLWLMRFQDSLRLSMTLVLVTLFLSLAIPRLFGLSLSLLLSLQHPVLISYLWTLLTLLHCLYCILIKTYYIFTYPSLDLCLIKLFYPSHKYTYPQVHKKRWLLYFQYSLRKIMRKFILVV